jgi:hypothetical protein
LSPQSAAAPAILAVVFRIGRCIMAFKGVVTLSEIGTIWTINQQAKSLKILASKLAVVGEFH